MPLCRVHRGTQAAGPARDGARTIAGRGKPLAQIAAIGPYCRIDPGANHPSKNVARVGRELQLQQLLPNFLLRAAKKYDVTRKASRAAENAPAKVEKLVHGRGNVLA